MLIPLALQIYGEVLQDWLARHGVSADLLALEGPQERMRRIGSALNIETIDLLPTFRNSFRMTKRRLHLERDGHWNREGHRRAAAVVADELIGRKLLVAQTSAGR
jgi:hypothetical protein